MPAEICVRVFRFLIGNMVGFVGFVLFRIFNDFRKVFDAVFQLADGLICFFSGGGVVFQIKRAANLQIILAP